MAKVGKSCSFQLVGFSAALALIASVCNCLFYKMHSATQQQLIIDVTMMSCVSYHRVCIVLHCYPSHATGSAEA
jgi:hypothetical protein